MAVASRRDGHRLVTRAARQRSATTDVNGVYSSKDCPRAPTPSASTCRTSSRHDGQRRLNVGGTIEVRAEHVAGGAHGNGDRDRRSAEPAQSTVPTISQAYKQARGRSAAGRPRAGRHRRARARPHQQHAQRRPARRSPAPSASTTCSWSTASTSTTTSSAPRTTSSSRTRSRRPTVLTNGISAEYGRFSGGVDQRRHQERRQQVQRQLPREPQQPDVDRRDAAREGQPASRHAERARARATKAPSADRSCKDRLWFFGAGRCETANIAEHLRRRPASATRAPTPTTAASCKLTGTFAPGTRSRRLHQQRTRQATRSAVSAAALLDPATLIDRRPAEQPVRRELQRRARRRSCSRRCSTRRRSSGFRNNGGTSTDDPDSPFLTLGARGRARRTPLQRAVLRRDRPGGAQQPAVHRQRCRYCSRRSARARTTSRAAASTSSARASAATRSRPLATSSSPTTCRPAASRCSTRAACRCPSSRRASSRVQNWLPARGAEVDIKTSSLYVQDRWVASPRLTSTSARASRRCAATRPATSTPSTRRRSCRAWAPPSTSRATASTVLRHLRPLRGQVQPGAVRRQHQRRPAERSRLRLHGPGGAGQQLRARASTWPTTRRSSFATSRPRTCRWPTACIVADRARVHARRSAASSASGRRQGDLSFRRCVELRRGLRRARRPASSTCRWSAPTRQPDR